MKDLRMHSAEHILNAAMVSMFNRGRCFSAHIGKKKSKCDYTFDRPLTEKETEDIEKRVNEVVQADLPVKEEFVAKQDAETAFNLERLPEEAGDRIRIIRIGNYDACPCIGDHVGASGEIGEFRIISTSFEDQVLRVRFKLAKK